MLKLQVKRICLSSFILCFGLFVAASTIRNGLFRNVLLQRFSPVLFLGVLLIIIACCRSSKERVQNSHDTKYLVAVLFTALATIALTVSSGGLGEKLSLILSLFAPIPLLCFRLQKKSDLDDVFNIWLRFSRWSVIIIVFMNILDVVSGYAISSFFANYTGISSYFRQLRQHRCISYMGHPLFTCEILLTHYLLSNVFYSSKGEKTPLIDFFAPLAGIAFARGRVAFLLIIIVFVVSNFERKRAGRIVLGMIILVTLYEIGLFDAVLQRFTNYSFRDDVRNEAIFSLLSINQLRFYWLKGQSMATILDASILATALEYPILRWAYCFGILVSVLLSVICFVWPILKCVRAKNKMVLFVLLALIADVNSYSSLGDAGMKQVPFYVAVFLLLNAAELWREPLKKQKES